MNIIVTLYKDDNGNEINCREFNISYYNLIRNEKKFGFFNPFNNTWEEIKFKDYRIEYSRVGYVFIKLIL